MAEQLLADPAIHFVFNYFLPGVGFAFVAFLVLTSFARGPEFPVVGLLFASVCGFASFWGPHFVRGCVFLVERFEGRTVPVSAFLMFALVLLIWWPSKRGVS